MHASARHDAHPVPDQQPSRSRLLVVNDSDATLRQLLTYFSAQGYDVVPANFQEFPNGLQTLEALVIGMHAHAMVFDIGEPLERMSDVAMRASGLPAVRAMRLIVTSAEPDRIPVPHRPRHIMPFRGTADDLARLGDALRS